MLFVVRNACEVSQVLDRAWTGVLGCINRNTPDRVAIVLAFWEIYRIEILPEPLFMIFICQRFGE
jgi:hypothetical protein